MTQPMDDKEIRQYIEAFADGELDVEQNLRVLSHMAMNPDATRRVMHQQQLRQVVERAMREMTPPPPAELRAKVERLVEAGADHRGDDAAAGRPTVLARLARWLPAVAAALMLATAGVLFVQSLSDDSSNAKRDDLPIIYNASLLDGQRRQAVRMRHAACAKAISNLHHALQFGTVIAEMPALAADYLGTDLEMPVLDLSAMGYRFEGAGKCAAPGAKAVHMVYRGADDQAISLWVRAGGADELGLEAAKLYAADAPDASNPILIWRRGAHAYFLVGDAADHVRRAGKTLAGLP